MDYADTRYIADYLRILRKSQGLSQKDVADQIDISVRQYARVESGEASIGGRQLILAMDMLGASMQHIHQLALETANDELAETLAAEVISARRPKAQLQVSQMEEVLRLLGDDDVVATLKELAEKRRRGGLAEGVCGTRDLRPFRGNEAVVFIHHFVDALFDSVAQGGPLRNVNQKTYSHTNERHQDLLSIDRQGGAHLANPQVDLVPTSHHQCWQEREQESADRREPLDRGSDHGKGRPTPTKENHNPSISETTAQISETDQRRLPPPSPM